MPHSSFNICATPFSSSREGIPLPLVMNQNKLPKDTDHQYLYL